MSAAVAAVKVTHDPGFVPLVFLGVLVYFPALVAVRGVTVGEVRFLVRAALSRGTGCGGDVGLRGGRTLNA